jgi:ribosomal protein L7/L12
MSDNFGLNISKEDASELTRLVLGSVGRLIKLGQYTDFIRLQAIEDPFRFIADVEKHADTLEREDESKGGYHIRIKGISVEGRNNKIGSIKALRVLMNWGLADSKISFEALPGSGADDVIRNNSNFVIISKGWNTQESLEQSREWLDFALSKNFFVYDIIRLPNGTMRSQPAKYTP